MPPTHEHNITAAKAVDRESGGGHIGRNPGFSWIFVFFCWILASGRCPSGEISKFRFSWAPGEPEMTLQCPDQAPGHFLKKHVLKIFCQNRSHMPPHAQPPLRKWPQLDSLVMDFSPKPSLLLHFYTVPRHFPWKVTFSFWAFPGQFCFDFVFFVRLLAGKAFFYFPKKHDPAIFHIFQIIGFTKRP